MLNYGNKKKWSVLILATGFGNEQLRSYVREQIQELGFEANVYDAPGYPVDPQVHSHAACVEAISSHDIVLAFADESEGGEFQIDQIPAPMIDALRGKKILPKEGALTSLPTIFQVEVLTAKSLEKPTIVFVPEEVKTRIDQTLRFLSENNLELMPKVSSAPDPISLIKSRSWDELGQYYEVPTGKIKSFRQLAFLEKIRKTSPNYLSYYNGNNLTDLAEMIKSRLSGIVEVLIKEHVKLVNDRIETKRNPVGTISLQDLINDGLIISSPFESLSGNIVAPLLSNENDKGQLALSLFAEKDVLVLGSPGLGKTTASLLAFRDLAENAESNVEGYAPLYASWRMLPDLIPDNSETTITLDGFIRTLISLPYGRAPWSESLQLPRKKWIFVLDGLDESPLSPSILAETLKELTTSATLLLTCRKHDFERHLQNIKNVFNQVIELSPWGENDIRVYLIALEKKGKTRAYQYINKHLIDNQLPSFISFPLWLSMLTYLAERDFGSRNINETFQSDNYELLRVCTDAVAMDEIKRHETEISLEEIRKLWSICAWELQTARRKAKILSISELERILGHKESSLIGKVVNSLLDIFGVRVDGFFHEVFQEYWLAEYLVDRLVDNGVRAESLANYFSYQRSVNTNRLIRLRITSREDIGFISAQLQRAFMSANSTNGRTLFTKNQLVYLLGRIDDSLQNREFLKSIWNNQSEAPFVKHSAAFAAIMLGDRQIEKEYYNSLNESDLDDKMNRGYHLYYYGDINAKESEMPIEDGGINEAVATLNQLFIRLNRTEERHLNLRRIEMFTVRRFLETGRKLSSEIAHPLETINQVVKEATKYAFSDDYVIGVKKEADIISRIITKL